MKTRNSNKQTAQYKEAVEHHVAYHHYYHHVAFHARRQQILLEKVSNKRSYEESFHFVTGSLCISLLCFVFNYSHERRAPSDFREG